MYRRVSLALGVALSAIAPAAAQSADGSWTGAYVGGRVGYAWQSNHNSETVLFDRNLDGSFNDTVSTAAGANAFSPGFCGGAANASTPAGGCSKDKDGVEFAGHVGYDYQFAGNIVVGIVGEYGWQKGRDSVAAFSTTPAQYTMTRRLRDTYGVRGRLGYAAGNTLFFGTGGITWGKIKNSFSTSNTANTFTNNGNDTARGYRIGAGVEHKLTEHVALGVQFLHTQLKDNDYRVRAQGPAAATNPFLLGNAAGTDFARSADKVRNNSLAVTASYRF